MSDHWKSLANQFGIPGPADPPETQKHVDRAPSSAASESSSVGSPTPPAPKSPPITAAESLPAPTDGRPARKRSSMWGDDSDGDSAPVEPTKVDSPPAIQAQSTAPRQEPRPEPLPPRQEQPQRRQPDPLEAIVSVDREPTVPGFDVPEDRSPGAVKVPVRRSAWDALIGTLGIKTSSEAAAEKAAKPAQLPEKPPQSFEKPAAEQREPGFREGRGRDRDGGGRDRDGGGQRREQPAGGRSAENPSVRQPSFSRDQTPDDVLEPSGFGAGLIDDKPSSRPTSGEPTSDADEDRPRGRGRRGGSRRRGRGAERDVEVTGKSEVDADIDWELDSDDEDLDAPVSQTRSPDFESAPKPPVSADEEDGEFRGRPRRSRRRGQRQMLSVDDVESGRVAGPSDTTRAPSPRADDSAADRPRRRDEQGGRDRGPRVESSRDAVPRTETPRGEGSRSESPRGESGRRDGGRPDGGRPDRGPRPPRGRAEETGARTVPRSDARRPESVRGDDDFVEFDDDEADGFGSGLVGEAKPVAGEGDEPRPRPRRRRGRRGRGGAAREDRTEVEGSAELIDASDEVVELPAFDDDLEDDDEAERLRRRSRGGRSRGGRREPADRDTVPGEREPDPAPRGGDFAAEPKSRNVPTWLETVSLLVDSNIQRRSSGGGGGGNRNQANQGRGGRR